MRQILRTSLTPSQGILKVRMGKRHRSTLRLDRQIIYAQLAISVLPIHGRLTILTIENIINMVGRSAYLCKVGKLDSLRPFAQVLQVDQNSTLSSPARYFPLVLAKMPKIFCFLLEVTLEPRKGVGLDWARQGYWRPPGLLGTTCYGMFISGTFWGGLRVWVLRY